LRRYGKGYDFDDAISLGANTSGGRLRKIRKEFSRALGQGEVFNRLVRPPSGESEIANCMAPYTAKVFPGAIGSVDGASWRLFAHLG
jgi:hypothetical protein